MTNPLPCPLELRPKTLTRTIEGSTFSIKSASESPDDVTGEGDDSGECGLEGLAGSVGFASAKGAGSTTLDGPMLARSRVVCRSEARTESKVTGRVDRTVPATGVRRASRATLSFCGPDRVATVAYQPMMRPAARKAASRAQWTGRAVFDLRRSNWAGEFNVGQNVAAGKQG